MKKKLLVCLKFSKYGSVGKIGHSTEISEGDLILIGKHRLLCGNAAFNLCQAYCEKIVFWGANHYANKLPNAAGWLVWDKQAGKDVTKKYSSRLDKFK